MTVSDEVAEKTELEAFSLREVVVDHLREFCAECDRFIQWQYREIVRGNPSVEQREQHREKLKWALRTAKLLECVASDPDSASTSAVALLRAKIWQLEQSWKMLYDSVAESEVDRILTEVFPDEPRS